MTRLVVMLALLGVGALLVAGGIVLMWLEDVGRDPRGDR